MDKRHAWLMILYLVFLVLLIRYWPKAGFGVAAITALVLLFRTMKK